MLSAARVNRTVQIKNMAFHSWRGIYPPDTKYFAHLTGTTFESKPLDQARERMKEMYGMADTNVPRYELSEDGTFTIHQYHKAAPFSNFLPGVAGKWGIPMWAFYVNRGQAIACFGVQDKDHAILEFDSANLHHRRVALEGFRTFFKIKGMTTTCYEPFRMNCYSHGIRNRLSYNNEMVRITEDNPTLGIQSEVQYFTIPNEPFPALARRLTVWNNRKENLEIEVLDGLPAVVPFGVNSTMLKVMPFVTEGYLSVRGMEKGMPFFSVTSVPGDESETEFVTDGHFHLGIHYNDGKPQPGVPVVDPKIVFGEGGDRIDPYPFYENEFKPNAHQDKICQTACSMTYGRLYVAPGDTGRIDSLFGRVRSMDELDTHAPRMLSADWLDEKLRQNAELNQSIRDVFWVRGYDWKLTEYIRQSFFDNVLRGGFPLTLEGKEKRFIQHVFSRKHGDLERDYNFFRIEPTYFSQGNGNFRDVNQNRRNDVWFNPDVSEMNIRYFFNLMQPDGFNPLLCEGIRFSIVDEGGFEEVLKTIVARDDHDKLRTRLTRSFTTGFLFETILRENVSLLCPKEEFLSAVLSVSSSAENASHVEGYWSDHWMYSFDLLESFLSIFPDRLSEIVFTDREYTFRDTDVRVLPRSEKYVVNKNGQVRHLHSTEVDVDKTRLIASRLRCNHLVRTQHGIGPIYRSTLLAKIVTLLVNKSATISPSGMGIEMDGGRPGWCDSVNGIPSLFAAGLPEAYQLVHVIRMIRTFITNHAPEEYAVLVPVEVHTFFRGVSRALEDYFGGIETVRDLAYWDRTSATKEKYRAEVHLGFDGREKAISMDELLGFCDAVEKRLMTSFKGAVEPGSGLPATYVTHEVIDYEPITGYDHDSGEKVPKKNRDGMECVSVKSFDPHVFAPFLEGVIYRMRIEEDHNERRRLWEMTRNSPLYDATLKMYKISAGLDRESPEQGRTGGWPAGWFENESIFSHVEYKYLLQLLKSRMYEQFFTDLPFCLPPWLAPESYGRSPLENVSFIVSSVHDRPSFRGRGMQPRLSGTNAELVHIALILSFGSRPFSMRNGRLVFATEPVLPKWAFTIEAAEDVVSPMQGKKRMIALPPHSFAALFLGQTVVVYHNPTGKDTFGEDSVHPVSYELRYFDGRRKSFGSEGVIGDEALNIRNRLIDRIDIELR